MEDRKTEWKHFFTPQVRQEVVKKLFATLKNQLPFSDPTSVNKAESIAANFEKNIFHTATTKEDYINKINKKMIEIEDSSGHRISSSSAPSQSTALPRTANFVAAWHEQAYQELQSLRGICLPYLMEKLGRAFNFCVQERDSVLLGRYKRHYLNIEKMINFLLLPRSDIDKFTKEKFNQHQQIIDQYCHIQRKNYVPVQEHAQLHPPAARSQIPFPLRSRNAKPQLQPNMMSTSSPSGSQRGTDKRNVSNSYPHGSASFLCQNIASLPQQRSFSQKTSVNAHDPAIFPLQQQKHGWPKGIEKKKPQMLMQNIHEVPFPRNQEQPPVSQHSFPRIDKQNPLSLSKDEHVPHSQTNAKANNQTNSQFHAMKMPIMESPATDNGNQQQSTEMEPIERLCGVVASMSPRALVSAVNEIGSVMNMVDIIGESRAAVDESFSTSQICETEITATPWMKRRDI